MAMKAQEADFEAGFAQPLGIPVIYTCRDDMFENCILIPCSIHTLAGKIALVDSQRRDLENRIRALRSRAPDYILASLRSHG